MTLLAMRRYGLLAIILSLPSCGDPTPPPQTAEIDPAKQKQQLAAMHDEIERDNALAYQYQMMQAQQRAADEAARRKTYLEDRAIAQRERERLLRILIPAPNDNTGDRPMRDEGIAPRKRVATEL